jgi:MFS family permease
MYNASLNLGVAIGAIVDGFIVKYQPWRYIYYVAVALIGAVTLMIYFTFPERAYNRSFDAHGITTTLHGESKTYHHIIPMPKARVRGRCRSLGDRLLRFREDGFPRIICAGS